jgi:cysteinyl-tRNA synthetase
MSGKKEEFVPQKEGKVLFYSCGPTVYGPLHIGNARALIFSDLMYRFLKFIGYEVSFVRNYTDVDDKIINRAREEKISAFEVAKKYIDYCETDLKALGLLTPTVVVKVTETINEIIEMIELIIKNGHAYVVDGEVFFSIDSFPQYGKLSHRVTDELKAGARVEIEEKKKNPLDFTLWKPSKTQDEPAWNSPWGKGRPGWHIECSAMIRKWLGTTIDLHHGGQDLIFPHHENEIAQSESAHNCSFCNFWVHNAFLTMNKEKMSKSLGNILKIREFNEEYDPEILKYIFLSHHYRSPIDISEDLILKSIEELKRIYLLKNWAHEATNENFIEEEDLNFLPLIEEVDKTFHAILDFLFHDLNTPGALGVLFSLIREINHVELKSAGKPGLKAKNTKTRKELALSVLKLFNEKLNFIFNCFGLEPSLALKKLEEVEFKIQKRKNKDTTLSNEEIENLIRERAEARKSKDFAKADTIRKELEKKGIILIDSPQGTTWKYSGS